jgi:hypothetical protein
MAKATFHSLRGEKSALILVRPNAFVFSATPVYIPRVALPADIKEGDTFDIPDGYKLVDLINIETGKVRTAKDGSPLKVLAY